MTALLEMAAASGIGLFMGFVLTATYAAAAISRSQQRVRCWQAETAHARQMADRLARQVEARDRWPPGQELP